MATSEDLFRQLNIQLEESRLALQEQQKQREQLAACEERLRAKELEEQRLLAEHRSSRAHQAANPKLAEISAAVEAEQRQAAEIRRSLERLESRPQMVNVRKKIEAYNQMVAKEEAERRSIETKKELRMLRRRIDQVQELGKKMNNLEMETSSSPQAEIQKCVQKDATKEDHRLEAGQNDRQKAGRSADIPKDIKWGDIFKANTERDCRKTARNEDLLKVDTREDLHKDAKWHSIFKAATEGHSRRNGEHLTFDKTAKWEDIFKANTKGGDSINSAGKKDLTRQRDHHTDCGKECQEESQKNAKNKDYLKPAKNEAIQKQTISRERPKDVRKEGPHLKFSPKSSKDLPKGDPKTAKWKDIFNAKTQEGSFVSDSSPDIQKGAWSKDHQRRVEINELSNEYLQDNESSSEEQNSELERKIEEQLMKASYYHKELRWFHGMRQLRAQIEEQQDLERIRKCSRKVEKYIPGNPEEQENSELLAEEYWQPQSYKDIQSAETGASESSGRKGLARFRKLPDLKAMAERRARTDRAYQVALANMEAATAARDECLREVDRQEAKMKQVLERMKAGEDSCPSTSYSSGQSRAGPHLTMVGQYCPHANEYLVDQRPPVSASGGSTSVEVSSNLVTTSSQVPKEELSSHLTLFQANDHIFSHLLIFSHVLDGHLRMLQGSQYKDSAEVVELGRQATLMIEEQQLQPMENSLRWREMATKMLIQATKMMQRYFDLVDDHLAFNS